MGKIVPFVLVETENVRFARLGQKVRIARIDRSCPSYSDKYERATPSANATFE